jgi:cupin fold WbuC family metalloprotein
MARPGLNDEWFRFEPSGRTPAFFGRRDPVPVDGALVAELKEHAQREDTDVRICLHSSPDAAYHDMIVVQRRGLYQRPHRHHNKGETWHVIEGEIGAFVFDDEGTVVDARRLEPDGFFLYRIGDRKFHTVVPISATIVYHESKLGPFVPDADTVAAPWAPLEDDVDAARGYNEALLRLLHDDDDP